MTRAFFQPNLLDMGLLGEVDSCDQCRLYLKVKTPKMKPTGDGKLKIIAVGEANGANEDEQGVQFIGKAGQRLRQDITKLGYDLDKDFWKSNVVRCRPYEGNKNRTPTNEEMLFCRRRSWELINQKKPRAVWLFGGVALKSFLWDWEKGEPSVAKWRGWCIPDRKNKYWVLPMYHPSFLIRKEKADPALENLFYRDLQNALEQSLKPFPKFRNERTQIVPIEDSFSISSILRQALEDNRPLTFDYETTGLKPYREGHKIAYVGFARSSEQAYAFPFIEGEVGRLWRLLLSKRGVLKIAHNMKFEHIWSKMILNAEIKNWYWDTQLAAHVLDDRSGITSLGFQVAMRYGDFTFKNDADPWLKAPHGNDFNRVFDAPVGTMLYRVGLDALYEAKLYEDQQREVTPFLKKGYDFFHEGCLALADAEVEGIPIDEEYVKKQKKEVSAEHQKIKDKILDHPLIQKNHKGEFNPSSGAQISSLLFNKLGLEPPLVTDKGNPKVDAEALSILSKKPEIGGLITDILQYRKLDDLISTFINGLLHETWGGVLHPFFNLNLARSYRSSSSSINFQNLPARDEFSKQVIRSAFYPHPGHFLMEVDYGGQEVKVSATYNRDPELIRYVTDSTTDMHRDQAMVLFLIGNGYEPKDWKDNKELKKLRYLAKNLFVFPEFYGSWWDKCASNLWGAIEDHTLEGIPVREYLYEKGYKNLNEYKELVKEEERKFWKKFSVYQAWKDKQVQNYIDTGRVTLYHGFERKGLLSRNEVINTPIQGTAFHLLLWSFIQLNKLRKKYKWKTKLIGQIHDSIVASVHPDEKDMIIETFQRVMVKDIAKVHKWLIVNLEIEIGVTEVDKPWSTIRGL
jgi:uracil-DNA glycosylase family 4